MAKYKVAIMHDDEELDSVIVEATSEEAAEEYMFGNVQLKASLINKI